MHISNLLFSVTKWWGHCSRAGNNGCPLASTSGQPKLLTKDTELTHNELLQWEGRLKRVQFPTQLAVFYSFKCQGDGVQYVPLWGALLTATVLQQERQRGKGWKWRDGRATMWRDGVGTEIEKNEERHSEWPGVIEREKRKSTEKMKTVKNVSSGCRLASLTGTIWRTMQLLTECHTFLIHPCLKKTHLQPGVDHASHTQEPLTNKARQIISNTRQQTKHKTTTLDIYVLD